MRWSSPDLRGKVLVALSKAGVSLTAHELDSEVMKYLSRTRNSPDALASDPVAAYRVVARHIYNRKWRGIADRPPLVLPS